MSIPDSDSTDEFIYLAAALFVPLLKYANHINVPAGQLYLLPITPM